MCANKTNTKHLGKAHMFYAPKLKNWKHSDLVRIEAIRREAYEYEQVI